jgi:hypothetical protein
MRRYVYSLALSCLLFFLSFSPIKAASWYVDNQASGSNNGTSWTNAWKSFSTIAWTSLKPGDYIYISGGSTSKTYNERLIIGASGASGNPITITKGRDSGHNGRVIIDGKLGSFENMVNITSRNYITVSNLEVLGAGSGGHGQIYFKSTNGVIIENNITFDELSHAGIFSELNQNYIIRNNVLDTPAKNCSGQTDGIYSQRDTNPRFEANHITIRSTNADCHCDCIQMYIDESPTLINNYCEHNDGKTTNSQGFYATTSTGTMTAVGNITYSPTSQGYQIALKLSSGAKLIAYHNTLVANTTAYTHTLYTDSSVTQTSANNLIKATSEIGSYIVSVANRDFHLKAGSSAIGAGKSLSLAADYSRDLDGKVRGSDGKWDLGSYEYGGSNITQNPTKPPTITIKPTGLTATPTMVIKLGDTNNDNLVNGVDYSTWSTNYTKALNSKTNGDFNNDGVVNGIDYVIWLNNYGE